MAEQFGLPNLLVAMPHLQDPNFKRAVVLILEHSVTNGAMGFIINRFSGVTAKRVIADLRQHADAEDLPVWFGGPVQTESGVILTHQEKTAETEEYPGLILSSNAATFRDYIEYARNPQISALLYPYRFVVGYSGWGPGQLESEIRAGSWIQVPVTGELLFNVPQDSIWEAALASMGIDPLSIATNSSERPSLLN
jgi:putative transcriptional regulator